MQEVYRAVACFSITSFWAGKKKRSRKKPPFHVLNFPKMTSLSKVGSIYGDSERQLQSEVRTFTTSWLKKTSAECINMWQDILLSYECDWKMLLVSLFQCSPYY